MEWYLYLATAAIGVVAGFLNTLAGGGSALTLPFLIFLGLPATTANGTNRISIIIQSFTAVAAFRHKKVFELKEGMLSGTSSLAGALAGALVAVSLNELLMRRIIGAVLILMLLLVVFKPEIWIRERAGKTHSRSAWLSFLIFLFIGFYGGVVQAGVGFFLLTGLVLFQGYDLMKANALKVLIVLLYTPITLVIFIAHHQVDYGLGFLLAAGSSLGAWIGAKTAIKAGNQFIRWVLILALSLSALKLFNVI